MHILVTGGAGFIGSHTTTALLEAGHHVTVLDNFSTGRRERLPQHSQLNILVGDVNDAVLLQALVPKMDVVLHLAAIVSVPETFADPLTSLMVNTRGFVSVLEAIRHHSPHTRCVYASSAAVYGVPDSLPCRDDLPLLAPALSPYAIEKRGNEVYAALYAERYGLNILGLRYFNVYGRGQDPNSVYAGVVSRFIAAVQHNHPITIYGDGAQTRDFIHIEDIVNNNCAALDSSKVGVVNVATGRQVSLLDLVAYLRERVDADLNVQHLPAREGDIRHSYADIRHMLKAPRISFREGLDDLL